MPQAVRLLFYVALLALLVHVAHTVFGAGGSAAHLLVDDWLYTLVLSAGLAICAATTAVQAQALIEEWGTAKFPAPRR